MSDAKSPLQALGELAQLLSEYSETASLPGDSELAELLRPIHPSDLADLISAAPIEARVELFAAIPEDEHAAEVLALVDEGPREELLGALPLDRKVELVAELHPDDAADVVAELPQEERAQVLDRLDAEDAAEVRELASYPPDSAGGIMNTEYVVLHEGQTVRAALMQIKTGEEDWEEIADVFVINDDEFLVGSVEINELLRSRLNQPLKDVMETEPVSVGVQEDQEEAAKKAAHYRLSTLPVVSEAGRLVGVITHDDVMEALGEEASEDMFRLAGTLDTHPYREGLIDRLSRRFPFLLVTIFGTYLVAVVIQMFYDEDAAGILAYVPMIAALAGNAGIQASTMMIRGFATGDIGPSDFGMILSREFSLGILTGISAGVLEFLLMLAGGQSRDWLLTVPLAQALSVIVATILGTVIPFACLRMRFRIGKREFRIDPALAAGPFITTLNDIASTAIALALAFGLT